jgi:hypothetical protein
MFVSSRKEKKKIATEKQLGSYHILKKKVKEEMCYIVMNRKNCKIHSYCTTEENAKKQLRLLYKLQNDKIKSRIKKRSYKKRKTNHN